MVSRLVCALVSIGLLIAVTAFSAAQDSTKNPTSPFVQVTLNQQLEKGLKCRRPVEFEFVHNVVRMVEKKKLPLDIVNKSYAWSRQRNNFRPFVYFQASLIKLAASKNITLDEKGNVVKRAAS